MKKRMSSGKAGPKCWSTLQLIAYITIRFHIAACFVNFPRKLVKSSSNASCVTFPSTHSQQVTAMSTWNMDRKNRMKADIWYVLRMTSWASCWSPIEHGSFIRTPEGLGQLLTSTHGISVVAISVVAICFVTSGCVSSLLTSDTC